MSSEKTKDIILHTAIDLFNWRGVDEVTLRDIALECGISPGNLAYHYKNKDYLIRDAFRQMTRDRDKIFLKIRNIPSFQNVDNQLKTVLELSHKYQFLFLDMALILRKYPNIAKVRRLQIVTYLRYGKASLDYAVGTDNVLSEEREGQYKRLSNQIWMYFNFWLAKQQLLNPEDIVDYQDFRIGFWEMLLPILTEKGKYNLKKVIPELFQNSK